MKNYREACRRAPMYSFHIYKFFTIITVLSLLPSKIVSIPINRLATPKLPLPVSENSNEHIPELETVNRKFFTNTESDILLELEALIVSNNNKPLEATKNHHLDDVNLDSSSSLTAKTRSAKISDYNQVFKQISKKFSNLVDLASDSLQFFDWRMGSDSYQDDQNDDIIKFTVNEFKIRDSDEPIPVPDPERNINPDQPNSTPESNDALVPASPFECRIELGFLDQNFLKTFTTPNQECCTAILQGDIKRACNRDASGTPCWAAIKDDLSIFTDYTIYDYDEQDALDVASNINILDMEFIHYDTQERLKEFFEQSCPIIDNDTTNTSINNDAQLRPGRPHVNKTFRNKEKKNNIKNSDQKTQAENKTNFVKKVQIEKVNSKEKKLGSVKSDLNASLEKLTDQKQPFSSTILNNKFNKKYPRNIMKQGRQKRWANQKHKQKSILDNAKKAKLNQKLGASEKNLN